MKAVGSRRGGGVAQTKLGEEQAQVYPVKASPALAESKRKEASESESWLATTMYLPPAVNWKWRGVLPCVETI